VIYLFEMLMERELWLGKIQFLFFEVTTYKASFVPDASSGLGAEGRAFPDIQCPCLWAGQGRQWDGLPERTVLAALPLTCWHVRASTPALGS